MIISSLNFHNLPSHNHTITQFIISSQSFLIKKGNLEVGYVYIFSSLMILLVEHPDYGFWERDEMVDGWWDGWWWWWMMVDERWDGWDERWDSGRLWVWEKWEMRWW